MNLFSIISLFATVLSMTSSAPLMTSSTQPMRVVGWFNGDTDDIQNIPWDKYTHIVTGFPIQYPNGTIECNKNDTLTQEILKLANEHKRVVQWRSSFNVTEIFATEGDYNANVYNFFNSVGPSLEACGLHGVEFDFEWGYRFLDKIGIILPKYSNRYTEFLSDLKAIIPDKIVSADIGVWNFPSGYPLEFLPWVNVSMLNNGAFDFINTMSYHWSRYGSINKWEIDHIVLHDLWGMDLSRVNLGVPYFSMIYDDFKIKSEPLWKRLSPLCPNIGEDVNVCNNTPFVGKNMNYKIGKLARSSGFGGVFPWTLNYDSFENNNTLINYLFNGLQ